MYSLCENIVDMSYSMMNPENWILGNKNSRQVFSNLPTLPDYYKLYKLNNTGTYMYYPVCPLLYFRETGVWKLTS